jgi:hypothetical protein
MDFFMVMPRQLLAFYPERPKSVFTANAGCCQRMPFIWGQEYSIPVISLPVDGSADGVTNSPPDTRAHVVSAFSIA